MAIFIVGICCLLLPGLQGMPSSKDIGVPSLAGHSGRTRVTANDDDHGIWSITAGCGPNEGAPNQRVQCRFRGLALEAHVTGPAQVWCLKVVYWIRMFGAWEFISSLELRSW